MKKGTWCQDVRHQISHVAGSIPTMVDIADTVQGPCTAWRAGIVYLAQLTWDTGSISGEGQRC